MSQVFGDRVKQARELEGLSQLELAKAIGVSQTLIAFVETNTRQPTPELLEQLAVHTHQVPDFFRQPPAEDFPTGSLLYRARTAMTAQQKTRVRQYARMVMELADALLARRPHALPVKLMPIVGPPEEAARRARRVLEEALKIAPDEPITGLILGLEQSGVLVVAMPIEIDKGDAFCAWTGADKRRPVIVVSAKTVGDRLRLNVAHELGHLLLHPDGTASLGEVEPEANRFAAELLCPAAAMHREIEAPVTLLSLAQLKRRWGVSVQMLIRRARDLEIITQRRYTYLFEQIGAKGWRMREPKHLDVPIEKPRLLRRLAEDLFSIPGGRIIDVNRLADATHLAPSRVADLLGAHADRSDLPRRGQTPTPRPSNVVDLASARSLRSVSS